MLNKKSFWLSVISFLLLTNCAGPTGDIPRFHEISPGKTYRLAQPTAAGIALLAKQGVRTLIKLNADNLDMERTAATANGIRLIERPLPGLGAPAESDENFLLTILNDPSLWPIAFHCEQGQDRTGLLAALYRVLVQGWTPAAAHEEWMKLGHSPLLFEMDNYFKEHVCAPHLSCY